MPGERIEAAVPADAPWTEQARAALEALLEYIEEEPLRARLGLVEVQTAGPAAIARYEESLNRVAEMLRRVREQSEVPAELPPTLEFAVVGGLYWFLQQRITQGKATKASELLPEALEIVVEPYLGPDATQDLIAPS